MSWHDDEPCTGTSCCGPVDTPPTLVEFLTARLDADEAQLLDGAQGTRTSAFGWHTVDCGVGLGYWALDECTCRFVDRMLVEVQAKRSIVERYADYLSAVRAYRSPRWADAMNEPDKEAARQAEARHRVAEEMAQRLAQPYAEHPDYRQEWAL